MPQIQYPFIDIAVYPAVRARFAAGEAIVLFSRDMKDVLWANLEVSSLEAAVELEDRNQLMLGFTENLPEAMRAFKAGRAPVYTDEPRRDLFSG